MGLTKIVALRTTAGVPGTKSTARTHRERHAAVGKANSCVRSGVSAGSVTSDSSSSRSGVPRRESACSVTAAGVCSRLPTGLPPVTHVSRTFSSRAVSVGRFLNRPGAASTLHGGMCPAMSSVRIDSPQGTASLAVISDIGATPPAT